MIDAKYIRPSNEPLLLSAAADEEGNGVVAVSLDGLGDDHEAVGESMAKSVAAWLDAEVRSYSSVICILCGLCSKIS